MAHVSLAFLFLSTPDAASLLAHEPWLSGKAADQNRLADMGIPRDDSIIVWRRLEMTI